MEDFEINGINNHYIHRNPNPLGRYGLALSFWTSNLKELIFVCELLRKTWINQELVDLSVASFAVPSKEEIERLKESVNYIIQVSENRGHQDGTTTHANAALYPLMHNQNIEFCVHTDADVFFLNQSYFFGHCTMLKDSGRFILTSQDTYLYDLENLTTSIYTGHDICQTEQFGSYWVFQRQKALDSNYYPLKMFGHFEADRYRHFIDCGFTVEKDALILKRAPIDVPLPNDFLYSADMHLGVWHQLGDAEVPEIIDRKVRLLQLMYTPAWENMTLGFRQHYNPKSPRQIK